MYQDRLAMPTRTYIVPSIVGIMIDDEHIVLVDVSCPLIVLGRNTTLTDGGFRLITD